MSVLPSAMLRYKKEMTSIRSPMHNHQLSKTTISRWKFLFPIRVNATTGLNSASDKRYKIWKNLQKVNISAFSWLLLYQGAISERSGNAPLSLTLDSSSGIFTYDSQEWSGIFGLHCSGWARPQRRGCARWRGPRGWSHRSWRISRQAANITLYGQLFRNKKIKI